MTPLPKGRTLGQLMHRPSPISGQLMHRPSLISGDEGLVVPGNVNLFNRPSVWNPEAGGYSSVYSTSFNVNGLEVLVPRISDDGRVLSEDEALEQYLRTGKHLGIFEDPESANRAGGRISRHQGTMGRK